MDSYLAQVPFTTSGALSDLVDKKILVTLRDGKKLIGVLRSYDQFANLVLQDTIERIHVRVGKSPEQIFGQYANLWRGVYIVRGENVVLLGEVDLDREDEAIQRCVPAPIEAVLKLQEAEQKAREETAKRAEQILFENRGFGREGDDTDRY